MNLLLGIIASRAAELVLCLDLYLNIFFIFRKVIEKIDQSEFDGFEYVNPLLMSMEDCVWGSDLSRPIRFYITNR